MSIQRLVQLLSISIFVLSLVACQREETTTTTTTLNDSLARLESLKRAEPVGDTFAYTTDTSGRNADSATSKNKLMPVDEAFRETSFPPFRNSLLRSIGMRDTNALYQAIDSNIHWSFGAKAGITSFKNFWKPGRKDSPIWKTLEDILNMGGKFRSEDPATFWAPYVYAAWPEGKDAPDPFGYSAVISNSAKVYESEDSNSAAIATLDHDFVKVLRDQLAPAPASKPIAKPKKGTKPTSTIPEPILPPRPYWTHIKLEDGRSGFIRTSDIRSQLDYRAAFKKKNGEWKMVALIAGD
jgi:hypothetical protein